MTLSYADTHASSGDVVWSTSLVVSCHVIVVESTSATVVQGNKNKAYKLKINLSRIDLHLNYTENFSSYITENKLRLLYKNHILMLFAEIIGIRST
jgi:hypothetical protein